MSLSQRVAANIRKLRASKRLSQSELGRRAGYTVSMVSMVERHQRVPPLDGLERIAKALGVTPVALLD